MQIGIGNKDPEVETTSRTIQKTYKMFWYQKDVGQWNIICDSSWKYTDATYSKIRVWALVADTVFNAQGFDAKDVGVCPATEPCLNSGYCCGPLIGGTVSDPPRPAPPPLH